MPVVLQPPFSQASRPSSKPTADSPAPWQASCPRVGVYERKAGNDAFTDSTLLYCTALRRAALHCFTG